MGHRLAKGVAVVVLSSLVPATASAAPPLSFNGWDFSDWFPDMFAQATEAYNALAPVGLLIMGAILAGLLADELLRVIRVARRGPDEDPEEE